MARITIQAAEEILKVAKQIGNKKIKNGQAPAYSDSVVCESFLVGLLQEAASSLGIDPDLIKHHGGHSFPDVSLEFSGIGIELKGSSSNRKFNGNSVVASTMIPNLKKIFLFYWIGSIGEVGYKDYFECVSSPVVTHSPRFQLDIDLDPKDSMFGNTPDKVGDIDKIIFSSSGIDSGKIIKWMADNSKKRGETPWWISTDESLPSGSTGLVKCTNLAPNKRRAFMKSAFLAFPQIFDKTSRDKYNGLFEWAIVAKSVLSTRDDYSAGGKVAINLPMFCDRQIEVPQVIKVAIDSLSVGDTIYLSELEDPHNKKFTDVQEFLNYYKKNLPKYLEHIYLEVKNMDEKKLGPRVFSEILATHLVNKIRTDTLVK